MTERASCFAWAANGCAPHGNWAAGGGPACHARGMRIAADGSAAVGRMVLVTEFVDGRFAFVLAKPLFLRADDRVRFSVAAGVTVTSVSGESARPAGDWESRCWSR